MALIYRSIFGVDDPSGGFVDRAAVYFTDWVRIRVYDQKLELPENGRVDRPEHGIQISVATAEGDGLRVFRGALFEKARFDGAEVETQLIAIRHEDSALAWIDIDRSATHALAETDWVPTAPNVVKRILEHEEAFCGPTLLLARPIECDTRATSELVDLILDPKRETPIVIVAPRTYELSSRREARSRAEELSLRLRGVASVAVLDDEAAGVASKRLRESLGDDAGLDVGDGEVHAYLAGISVGGYRRDRHHVVRYREIEGEPETKAALILAPILLRRAVEITPPAIWRTDAKGLIDRAGSDERSIRLSRLIAIGESAQLEFKSSLRYDIQTGGANKALVKSVTKTLAAFLNCEGGTLLIGVNDGGEVVGIENDLRLLSRKPTVDGWELHLREAIGEHLGNDISPAIEVTFTDSSGKTVALVSCAGHEKPVFFDDRETVAFYVRTGNGTRPLDVRETTEYIARRWPLQPRSRE